MISYQIGEISINADELDYQDLSRDDLLELYWASHPRFRFLKDCDKNANLLDIGASTGGLFFWKQWGKPDRSDIRMTGIDLEKGEYFDYLDDYRVINIDNAELPFENTSFNTIMISNVGEHIRNFTSKNSNAGNVHLLNEIFRVLDRNGKCYIELPSHSTKQAPSRRLFLEQGIPVSTVNFYDDRTHIDTMDPDELAEECIKIGFKVVNGGYIENDFLVDKLLSYGILNKDAELVTYGAWLKFSSEHYLVLSK